MRWLRLMLVSLLWANSALAESQLVTVQLTHNDFQDADPVVNSEGVVAWIGLTERSSEVFVHDGLRVVQLTDNDEPERFPVINDAGRIVWVRELENEELFLFDSGVVARLTWDRGTSLLLDDRNPTLNKFGHVAWMKHSTVMYFDNRTRRPIATNVFGSARPAMNDRSEIAWAQGSTTQPDVFLYSRGQVTRLATRGGPPSINDLFRRVVWHGRAGSARGVYWWDERGTRLIWSGQETSGPVALNNLGHMAWSAFDGNDREIYLWIGATIQITDNDVDDFSPRLNDQDKLVWVQGNGSAADIMLHNGYQTSALSHGGLNWAPAVSDGGHVVWWGRKVSDSSAQEIFLALPLAELLERLLLVFETAVANGDLVGAAPGDLASFETRLAETATRLIDDPVVLVCPDLIALFQHADGNPQPTDDIEGNGLQDFQTVLLQVADAVYCTIPMK